MAVMMYGSQMKDFVDIPAALAKGMYIVLGFDSARGSFVLSS